MLVLARRIGEAIVIDNTIEVTVLSTHNGQVRLGINAPRDVRVDRQEVHDRISGFTAPSPTPTQNPIVS
jgi:carbon storage regulator